MSIYANAVPKLRRKIKITVNDSLEFTMPDGNFPLPVALPNNVVSKVCITLQSVSYCRTLSPCPYALHYYEAEITSGGKPIDLEFRSEEEYLSYLTKTH